MKVTSREYKVMLDHLRFAERKKSLREFWKDLFRIAQRLCLDVTEDHGFKKLEYRTVRFLDTPAGTFRQNNLILRQRREFERRGGDLKAGSTTVTLKCRCADRYVVAGQNLEAGAQQHLAGKPKFEEDIAPPFLSRFSRSVTIEATRELPTTLADVSEWFSCLGELSSNGLACSPETPVTVVNELIAHERVYSGPVIKLGDKSVKLAVILWAHRWKSRPIAAEFSFRYGDEDEHYPAESARQAMDLFAAIQGLDWCQTIGSTKTQIAYGVP